MSAKTGSALVRKHVRAQGLTQQFLDAVLQGQRDMRDLDCLLFVLQALKDGHLHEVRVKPRRILRIDCDAPPRIPEDWWEIRPEDQIASRVRGKLAFDPAQVVFHLDEGQQDGRIIVGDDLLVRLAGKPVLPVQVLDALLANTAMIPES